MPPKAKGPTGRFARRSKRGSSKFNPIAAFCNLFSKSKGPLKNEMSTAEASLWLMLFYYWIGCIMYSDVLEGWSTLDAMYFLTYTMTTVGYGDMGPSTTASRVFTLFWALVGVGIIAVALVEIAGMIMDARDAIQARTRAALMKAGSSGHIEDPEVAAKLAALKEKKEKDAAVDTNKNPLARLFQKFPVLWCVVYVSLYMLVFGLLFAFVEEDWSVIDGCYFAIVTGTSVGYGDLAPQTKAGRLISLLYVPFAVVFVGQNLSAFADGLMGGGSDDKLAMLMNLDLSLEALMAMDEDGDGEITEFEFLRFMLVSSEIADPAVLDSLHEKFCSMDEDGSGFLSAEDLKVEPLGIRSEVSGHDTDALQALWAKEKQEHLAAALGKVRKRSFSASSFDSFASATSQTAKLVLKQPSKMFTQLSFSSDIEQPASPSSPVQKQQPKVVKAVAVEVASSPSPPQAGLSPTINGKQPFFPPTTMTTTASGDKPRNNRPPASASALKKLHEDNEEEGQKEEDPATASLLAAADSDLSASSSSSAVSLKAKPPVISKRRISGNSSSGSPPPRASSDRFHQVEVEEAMSTSSSRPPSSARDKRPSSKTTASSSTPGSSNRPPSRPSSNAAKRPPPSKGKTKAASSSSSSLPSSPSLCPSSPTSLDGEALDLYTAAAADPIPRSRQSSGQGTSLDTGGLESSL